MSIRLMKVYLMRVCPVWAHLMSFHRMSFCLLCQFAYYVSSPTTPGLGRGHMSTDMLIRFGNNLLLIRQTDVVGEQSVRRTDIVGKLSLDEST